MRTYARVVGASLLSPGVVGLIGSVNGNPAVGLQQVIMGGLFLYLGLGRNEEAFLRHVVGGLGEIYPFAFALSFVAPALMDLPADPSPGSRLAQLTHAAPGYSSIVVAVRPGAIRSDMATARGHASQAVSPAVNLRRGRSWSAKRRLWDGSTQWTMIALTLPLPKRYSALPAADRVGV